MVKVVCLAAVRVGRCGLSWRERNTTPSGTGIPVPVGGEGKMEGWRDGGQWRSMTMVITLPEIRMDERGREHPVRERREGWRYPTTRYLVISRDQDNAKPKKNIKVRDASFIRSLLKCQIFSFRMGRLEMLINT